MARPRVIIMGGGFAGIKCARTLRKAKSQEQLEVVLFNRENHMVFHPLLAEVAGGSVAADAVAAPLRQMLPRVSCRTEEIQRIDLARKVVVFEGYDGKPRELGYDHVVLAPGSIVNLGLVPGMSDHSYPLKTIGDAVALRVHVMEQLEKAEVADDAEHRRFLLSFIVVGGGYSGVEAAGEINQLARGSLRYFQNIRRDDIKVSLIHSRDQILPEISASLRDFAKVKMEEAGISMVLESRCAVATSEGVALKDGREIRGATVVCTIGNAPSPVVERLDVPKEKTRLVTDADMRIQGQTHAWAVGDGAQVMNAHDDKPSPPTGQFAERQGKQAAKNILRVLAGEPTEPFSFKPLGQLCAIGHHSAVAEIMGFRISGFIAWVLWRGIYLMKMPSFSRRVKVGFDWAWQIVFSRDLSHVKANRTERVCTAYYRPGDYIFHEGDPAANFYSIQSGEVEVVRESGTDEPEIIATLGQGGFFGEMALMSNAPRSAGVRAKTEAEVVVMGKQVFSRISGSLQPLRDLLTEAVKKRGRPR